MSAAQQNHRIQGLDALRGLAILLVMLRHSWPDTFGGAGIVGVVAFFTLSGYLITGLLANDVHTYGRVRYGRFYRNRAIRLLPALGFVLIGYAVVEGVFGLGSGPAAIPRTVIVAATYTANVPGLNHGSPDMSHLWTLANEEQFYLVWPLLLFLGIRFRKLWLTVTITTLLLAGALVLTVLTVQPLERIYTWPTTWTVAMLIGAAGQLGRDRINGWLNGRRVVVGALIGLAALAGMSFLPDAKNTPASYLFGGALIGVATMLLIWWLKDVPVFPLWARPVVWLGTISYAAYLWNYPIGWWLRDAGVEAWQVPAVLLTVLAATVSWYVVERPANLLKTTKKAPARRMIPAEPGLVRDVNGTWRHPT